MGIVSHLTFCVILSQPMSFLNIAGYQYCIAGHILLFQYEARKNRSKKYRLFQVCFFDILISYSGMHKAENMLLSMSRKSDRRYII